MLWVSVVLSLPLWSMAQVTGQLVTQQENKKVPLAGAGVQVLGTKQFTFTDTAGKFEFAMIKPHSMIAVQMVGYQTDTFHYHGGPRIQLVLKPDTDLKGVVLTHQKKTYNRLHLDAKNTIDIGEGEIQRAACCNIGESFQSNPTVDASFSDALTGTRQIKLLGLNSSYSLFTQELSPTFQGLDIGYGLESVPAAWVSGIQLTKGPGSISSGMNSLTGQINLELKKPDADEWFTADLFLSQAGRTEFDLGMRHQLSKSVSTRWMVHGAFRPIERDQNEDGFRDFPLEQSFTLMNRWKFENDGPVIGQLVITHHHDEKTGGQIGFDGTFDDEPSLIKPGQNPVDFTGLFGMTSFHQSTSVRTKTGYIFDKPGRSLGFITTFNRRVLDTKFGNVPTSPQWLNAYSGQQYSGYGNLLFMTRLGETARHSLKSGLSMLADDYVEVVNGMRFARTELLAGIHSEYTFTPNGDVSVVLGGRADHHNQFGWLLNGRMHLRYRFNEDKTTVRGVIGTGSKTYWTFVENMGLFATNRRFTIQNPTNNPYRFPVEKSWTTGFSLDHEGKWGLRDAGWVIDGYYTEFSQRMIADLYESARTAPIIVTDYSSSATAQVQLHVKPRRHVELRGAYRFLAVEAEYESGIKQIPFLSRHRAFGSVEWTSRNGWSVDALMHWIGSMALPNTSDNPESFQIDGKSPSYELINLQTTKKYENGFSFYFGVENILNFRQENPILSADRPFGPYFDASMIWGPIFGRMAYGGIRYRIKYNPKEEHTDEH